MTDIGEVLPLVMVDHSQYRRHQVQHSIPNAQRQGVRPAVPGQIQRHVKEAVREQEYEGPEDGPRLQSPWTEEHRWRRRIAPC